jgi:hypothetical protein
MTDQYRATPKQWDNQKAWAVDDDDSSCILELRARVEALEARYETQRQATLAWGKDVDNHGRWIDDPPEADHGAGGWAEAQLSGNSGQFTSPRRLTGGEERIRAHPCYFYHD